MLCHGMLTYTYYYSRIGIGKTEEHVNVGVDYEPEAENPSEF